MREHAHASNDLDGQHTKSMSGGILPWERHWPHALAFYLHSGGGGRGASGLGIELAGGISSSSFRHGGEGFWEGHPRPTISIPGKGVATLSPGPPKHCVQADQTYPLGKLESLGGFTCSGVSDSCCCTRAQGNCFHPISASSFALSLPTTLPTLA